MSVAESWLLGDAHVWNVPRAWRELPNWESVWDDDLLQSLEKKVRINKAPATLVAMREFADLLVARIAEVHPGWLDAPIFNAERLEVELLRQVPRLDVTDHVLSELRFHVDAPASAIAAIPRRSLLADENGSLCLLDLSLAFELPAGAYLRLSESSTLERAASLLQADLIRSDGKSNGEAWSSLLGARNGWGQSVTTLDACGAAAGVTRERVRQIETALHRRADHRVYPLPEVVASAVEMAVSEAGLDGLGDALEDAGLTDNSFWTVDALVTLLVRFGYPAHSQALRQHWREAVADLASANHLHADAVRTARDRLGLVRLNSVVDSEGQLLTSEEAVKALKSKYSRVFVADGVALAGSKSQTMLEGNLAKQFAGSSQLRGAEILSGLDRVRRHRKAPPLPSNAALLDLLQQSGAMHAAGPDLFEGPAAVLEPGGMDEWLLHELSQYSGKVAHRSTILNSARQQGLNVSSFVLALSYWPTVRGVGSNTGLIRAVGSDPTPEEMQHAIDVMRALYVPTDFSWRVESGAICLSISLGNAVMDTGVISVPSGLAMLLDEGGYSISCTCEQEFGGRLTRNPDNSWLYGFQPVMTHFPPMHGIYVGDSIEVRLQDGKACISV